MPLSPNGKIDRRALPAPGLDREGEHVAPRTDVEERLVRVWKEVLGVEHIGVHDDFFDLGGHSLLVARLVTAIEHEFSVSIPMRDVFEQRDVAGCARIVEAALKSEADALMQEALAELGTLSPEEVRALAEEEPT